MSLYLRSEPTPSALPQEFINSSWAFLESSEQLNSAMVSGAWQGSFNRGEATLWLAFHATELFLKGCIIKLDPSANPSGHTLNSLLDKLLKLKGSISFELPFSAEALPPTPEGEAWAKEQNAKAHQNLRYPADTSGKSWPGVKGFCPESFSETLAKLRAQMESTYNELFNSGRG